jgi:cell division protease FtsH
MRELFKLARDNQPCVIFIDEIDAMGRKRSGDGETSSSERDSTLNELLVQMDGFTSAEGIFVMAASNRADLLDPALMRPGRIDKRIFIGPPDAATREEILNIHLTGKPRDMVNMTVDHLVDITASLSCAQIENLLNEAMLCALRDNRYVMNLTDVNMVMNRMMVGWQPNEHQASRQGVQGHHQSVFAAESGIYRVPAVGVHHLYAGGAL